MLLHQIDDAFSQCFGAAHSLLHGGLECPVFELVILCVHGFGHAVAEDNYGVARFELHFAGFVRDAFHHAERQSGEFAFGYLLQRAALVPEKQGRGMASIDESDPVFFGVEKCCNKGYETIHSGSVLVEVIIQK